MSTNHPPPLSTLDNLLVARIDIPDDAVVAEIIFTPDSSTPVPDALEHARRQVLTLSASSSIFDVILPSVELGHHPRLFLFAIALNDRAQIITTLNDLCCDGLIAPVPVTYFPFRELHDRPRHIQSHFLNAVRTRLIDHLVVANAGLQRCKDGFLIYHHQAASATDWGVGWEYKALSRPLIFCHLQLQPTQSSLILHPTLLPTPYLPLASSLPLPPCSPILLLPYATPAYFLAAYSGPTSALPRLFTESLRGLGQPDPGVSFIIGWISVENKQGEDKGIVFIYPTRLCLAFVPSLNRPLLDCTPDLPAPLQPSPKLQSATTPLSERPPTYPHRPSLFGSPTTELNAFLALTLPKSKNIRTVAAQVSNYVDHIARDRERERERLKREREGATTSPSLTPRTVPSTSVPGPSISQPSLPLNSRPVPLPSQDFYPSPPQADSSSAIPNTGNTSPVLTVGSQQPAQLSSAHDSSNQPIPSTLVTPSSSFDSFGYLGMNMDDMSMDFGMDMEINFGVGMNINMNGGSNTNPAVARTTAGYNGGSQAVSLSTSTGMDFEDFTDDDFNFFDQPSTNASAPAPPPPAVPQASSITSSFNPASTLLSPPSFADTQSSAPGPPQFTNNASSTPSGHAPWSLNFPEGFTPCSVENPDSVVPPELMLSSPGVSSSDTAEGWPLTPGIHVEASVRSHGFDFNLEEVRKTTFDPIPFADYHRLADGKYAPKGKFGLLSPPPEKEDSAIPTVRNRSPVDTAPKAGSKKSTNVGWRTRYIAVTDPRVGVMRKLIGVKRKNLVQGGRLAKISHWNTECEDWKMPSSSFEDEQFNSEQSSDEGSHSGDELSEEEDTPLTSRPSTPPPAYLPLGPTLLHTQFHHRHLFPMSKPLRSSGSSISIPLTNYASDVHAGSVIPAANVPTPVSPAALSGQSDEKLKTLELVVSFFAREAVENVVWGETWLASNAFASSKNKLGTLGRRKLAEVWASDIKFVKKAFDTLEYLQGGLTIGKIFGLDAVDPVSPNIRSELQVMDPPKIVVGKGDTIIRILPTGLRFWEKLGLGPQCGAKDATVYVLYPDDGERHRQDEIEIWLSSISTAFETKHLGKLTPGTGLHCIKDGLLPVKFDISFRKSFAPFIANFLTIEAPIILFLVIPAIHMNVSSQALCQIISVMQKTLKSSQLEDRVVIQLIPEHLIRYMESEPSSTQQLEALCINLYDRISIPIDRPFARSFTPEISSIPVRTYIRKPVFTIARPLYHKVTYARSIHASLDVMDRYTLLHIGYRVSTCGKWLVVASIDQRGEAWDQAVYLLKCEQQDMDSNGHPTSASTPASASWNAFTSNQEETSVVKQVWDFALKFAKRADIEWRVVISKLGIMFETELAAWMELLTTNVPTCGLGSVHISIISADPDSSLMFTKLHTEQRTTPPAPTGKSSSSNKSILFTDISSTTYALFPTLVLPIPIPPTQSDIGLTLPYIADHMGCGTGAGDSETQAHSPTNIVNGMSTDTFTNPPIPISTDSSPHAVGPLPKSTTCLVRVPCSPPLTSISMLHIHLLHVHCYPCETSKVDAWDTKQLHADITRNFYELSVLAISRWKMSPGVFDDGASNLKLGCTKGGVNPMLPLHLAMVDTMGQVVESADTLEADS